MFDKTCLNRLARASNIKMFDDQTIFDDFWSSHIFRLARALQTELDDTKSNYRLIINNTLYGES